MNFNPTLSFSFKFSDQYKLIGVVVTLLSVLNLLLVLVYVGFVLKVVFTKTPPNPSALLLNQVQVEKARQLLSDQTVLYLVPEGSQSALPQ